MEESTNMGPGWKAKIGSFFIQSKRVWHILKKPTNEEFKSIAKVSALGVLVLGALGFLIADIITFVQSFFG